MTAQQLSSQQGISAQRMLRGSMPALAQASGSAQRSEGLGEGRSGSPGTPRERRRPPVWPPELHFVGACRVAESSPLIGISRSWK